MFMSIGKLIRSKFPWLYYPLVGVVNKIISLFRPYSIYITDNLGGSFKKYFISNNMPHKIEMLERNLDEESIQTIRAIIQRLLFYPDAKYQTPISAKREIVGGLLPVETYVQQQLINGQLARVEKSINLPANILEDSVFYFYHGLALLPQQIHEYINSQHFIDVGAYVGDSAIALSKYNFSKIFSLEISLKSIERYRHNMERNGIHENRYEIINAAITSSDNEPPLKIYDTGSTGLSLFRKIGKYDEIEVATKTLDSIVEQYDVRPKFIKADIEGAAMDLVKGAKNTFTKFRPVLSIAIYHNPIEFFEIKLKLEELLPDYIYLVRKLSSGVRNNLSHSEVVLLAYPRELID